jgi:putative transposase
MLAAYREGQKFTIAESADTAIPDGKGRAVLRIGRKSSKPLRRDQTRLLLRLPAQPILRGAMGRQSRIYVPDVSIHVIQRGNNGVALYRCNADYEIFLALLARAVRRRARVHAYVLMTNHFHLLVTPDEAGALSAMMRELDLRYTKYINGMYGRSGTLWNGRFRSFLIDSERYWLACLRYIEQNPLRAGLAERPELYRWSSHAAHGFGQWPEWLMPHPIYLALGPTPDARQAAYRSICAVPLTAEQLVLSRHRLDGVAVGSDTTATPLRHPR